MSNQLYYLCFCSHLFYLFHESFLREPLSYTYQQILNLVVDTNQNSCFMIELNVKGKIVFEKSLTF